MNLSKKKALAARTLNVGKERIFFVEARLDEIKEAMTKQDIRELHKGGAILIKEKKGRKKSKKKVRKSPGNKRKNIKKRKKTYMILTRKLRKYLTELKAQGKISKEDLKETRKKIRDRVYKSKAHLQAQLGEIKNENTKKKKSKK
jgi:large subunit ribosomal protein L19e